MTDATTWRERADAAWRPLRALVRTHRWRAPVVLDGPRPGAGPTSVWGLSQVLAAAVDLCLLDPSLDPGGPDLIRGALRPYRDGDGFGPYPGDRPRYYDDNAWIGLDLARLALVTGDGDAQADAARVLAFVRRGEDPTRGGVYWREPPCSSRHACSSAPSGELAARLALAGDGAAEPADLLAFARRMQAFLGRLQRDDGLYADHEDDRGAIDPAVYSYNQGTALGLDVLLHRLDGEAGDLERAHTTATAALDHFAHADRLWTHPPCFNAICFRNLAALDAHDAHPGVDDALTAYLERAWTVARHPGTGWFTEGGIGRYERGGVLDQSAWVQLFAIAALPREQRLELF